VTEFFAEGKKLTLGKSLGKGGEGQVFDLGDGQAAKIYTKPDAARESKLKAMISAKLADSTTLIAFPRCLIVDERGKFVGFVMGKVKDHTSLHELYAPGSRKVHFPRADYRFTIRAAANVARAVAKVHELGAVIGDINHSGILVSDKALSALIDADSFQFGPNHLCRVGVAEYTPPELQGKRLDGIIRTTDHDAFGLAVVIFQLLFMGRHPYVGKHSRGDMPIERAIAEHRFVYSLIRDVQMTAPPGTSRLADFPASVGDAFERAFGVVSSERPSAREWVKILSSLEAALSKCGFNSMHFYPSASRECLWCRMERDIGILLFLPSFQIGSGSQPLDPGAAGFNLAQIWAAIESIKLPNLDSVTPTQMAFQCDPSQDARSAKSSVGRLKAWGLAAAVVAVGSAIGAPSAWFVYVPLGIFGLGRLFGDTKPENSSKFVDQYRRIQTELSSAIEAWKKRIGLFELQSLKSTLEDAKNQLVSLPKEEATRLAQHETNRRDFQLHAFLERHTIRRSKIHGIGPAKIANLASYGIDTAADVVHNRILAVPGFGPATTAPLVAWRQRIAARFVFQQNHSTEELAEMARIRQSIASQAAQCRAILTRGALDMPRLSMQVNGLIKKADPTVDRVLRTLAQAEADLKYLGIPLPPVPKVVGAPSTVRPLSPHTLSAPRPGLTTNSTKSCPSCGGRMVRRQARRGRNAGSYFFGCAAYPRCRGTRSS
jgi:DNA-binding helix-hairpin-helix protein with protein kinase domain